jgi:hypothetical protein
VGGVLDEVRGVSCVAGFVGVPAVKLALTGDVARSSTAATDDTSRVMALSVPPALMRCGRTCIPTPLLQRTMTPHPHYSVSPGQMQLSVCAEALHRPSAPGVKEPLEEGSDSTQGDYAESIRIESTAHCSALHAAVRVPPATACGLCGSGPGQSRLTGRWASRDAGAQTRSPERRQAGLRRISTVHGSPERADEPVQPP